VYACQRKKFCVVHEEKGILGSGLSAGSSSRNDFLFALTARYSLFVRGCRQIASPSTDCSLIGLLGKASASPGQLKERLLVLERKAADATHCLDQSMDYRSQTPR
jgi:hypothetical protein